MKFNTLRFNISVLYSAILGVILVSYSAYRYIGLRNALYDEMNDLLEKKAQEVGTIANGFIDTFGGEKTSLATAVEKTVHLEIEGPDRHVVNAAIALWLKKVDQYDTRKDFIDVVDEKGDSIGASQNITPSLLSLFLKDASSVRQDDPIFTNIELGQTALRVISMPYAFSGHRQAIVQVGSSLESINNILLDRVIDNVISIPILLLLTSFIGALLARRILKPVLEITKTAEKITHEDLSARVKAIQADGEIKHLVNAFNEMISRLETSFSFITQFSSHVAHELKTPLAIMRGETQVALRSERRPEEYRKTLTVTLEESEKMIRVVEDMLLLTKLEYESEIFKFERLHLGEFLTDINERTKILASSKNITVHLDMPRNDMSVEGDAVHLRRLFFNLIDNAIKFSPEGKTIGIDVRRDNEKARISVSDQGIGIANADLPHVFEKFFHGDRLLNGNQFGTGLGLSVALSIARSHRGDIQVQSQYNKGSIFTVILPLA